MSSNHSASNQSVRRLFSYFAPSALAAKHEMAAPKAVKSFTLNILEIYLEIYTI